RLSEEALGRALASCVAYAKVVVEPSGAAALAAALEGALPATAKRVGVILSGGNVSTARLADLLARHPPHAVPPPG
ncbi:MAG: threonine/serine dehydratase, partial [Myxococcales bacterium]|nr:threonine/serine dehydratase [Myxococcales bacterium]